jgi:ferric-dicitrate binding protein FerR (iron transport regulator)
MNDRPSLLHRFFSNKYSRNDYLELKKLISSKDVELEQLMQSHWNEYKLEENSAEKDFSELLADIIRTIDGKSKVPLLKKILIVYSKVAAILIIPMLLAFGILYPKFIRYQYQKEVFVEVTSPAGSRTSLNLPDGSTVWLNGDSHIRYPVVFNQNRVVEIGGEAFFRVKSDMGNPFLVEAKGIQIKATGTEFNVSAYKDDDVISVILKEGKVAVMDANHSILKVMESGNQLSYFEKTSSVQYNAINAEDYTLWINGELIFNHSPMKEVVSRLERWYGVNIEIMHQELLQLHFKATFIDESLEEALKLLQSTSAFNYRFAKRITKKDGTLENTKIIFTKE